ncbi:ABC transporter ATP-binding protein [Microbispora rosea]|uniref:ABC transporter ATP-binding protein n=1 Tax=Microbispora rosea TaxID=58117 RepID=UPI003D8E5DA3
MKGSPASPAEQGETAGTAMKEAMSRSGTAATVMAALRLSRQADATLFWTGVILLPAVEGLLGVGLLLLFRGSVGVFLESSDGPAQATRTLIPWLAGAVLLTLVTLILGNLRHTLNELLVDRVRQFSSRRMHAAIAKLDLADFDYAVVHDRISRAEETADGKPRQVVRGVNGLLASAFQVAAFTVLLIVLEPWLLPVMALTAAPIAVVSSKLAGDRFAFFTRMTPLERMRRYVGMLITGRQAAAEVRSFRLSEHFAERYDLLTRRRYAELRKTLRAQWRRQLLGVLAFGLILCVVVTVLAWFYAVGAMDTSTVLTTVLSLSRLATAMAGLGGPLAELSEAGLFLDDQHAFYAQLMRRSLVSRQGAQPGPLRELCVRELGFVYPETARPALRNVDLTIRAGQIVAFVGPNGSGKTTLAKILAFLYEPSSGAVLWNGADTSGLSREGLRDQVTTVFQDHMTYHFSVAENVALGDTTRPDGQTAVRTAVDEAGAREFVDRLPGGYETPLGPEFGGGTALSGGERQRLAIARAFYRGRDLVIMDEPTSALDAQADHALLENLRKLLRGRTAIVVSHRFSNVRHADQIFVLKDGRILERGTHDSLMADKGLYAEMYTLQAAAYMTAGSPSATAQSPG